LYIWNDEAKMRVYVKGFGCSTSLADSEVLAGCLSEAGHIMVDNVHNAELVIYNTCAVKAPTENRMISLLRKVPEEKMLVVAGCLPLINLDRLRREVRFDGVVGPALGERIVDVVGRVSQGLHVADLESDGRHMPPLELPRIRINPKVSMIPINYGCLGSCAYCCVRFARGRLRSYGVRDIVNKVKRDLTEGVCEFWLTSQDTACYGKDFGASLAELIKNVCNVDGDFLVRVGMMTPNNLSGILEEVIEASKSEKVFKFLHLPVQSGDDGILRGMNRFYSVEDFVAVVGKFRKEFPESTIATDVIVGFPGETEKAFDHTLRLVEQVRPDVTNVSKFFARPGTSAGSLSNPVVPSEVKRRSACLARLARRIALEKNSGWVGWSGRLLVDEVGKPGSVVGRNFAYKPIVVRSPNGHSMLGQFVNVRVMEAFQSHLLGEIL
jgi:threonylcarbamoyladenosine tRNA methylthiotransferase CDKAL1